MLLPEKFYVTFVSVCACVYKPVCVRACVRVCMLAFMCACVRACVCVCVCVIKFQYAHISKSFTLVLSHRDCWATIKKGKPVPRMSIWEMHRVE